MFIKDIDKEIILRPLQIIIGIVEKKQTLPILSNILIEKETDKLRFTATDLEIQISTYLNIENQSDVAAITINGKKFQEIIRVLPEKNKLSIENKGNNKVEVKSNRSRFNLQALPAQDFPKLNALLIETKLFKLKQNKLKELLLSIQYAMAQQDVRYYLNGLLLIIEENKLKAVSTDGHRLAFNQIEIEGKHEKQEIILPRKAITELCKLLSDSNTESEDEIELCFSNQQMKATFSNISLITKIIDGKFPDYERVIPKHSNSLNINKSAIQQALQKVAILSNEKFRGVRFVLTEKNLSVISNNSEQEEAQEDIETDYHGEAIDIGFNVNYLLEGLNNISSETITIFFGDPNSSILITTPNNTEFRYVVMPMRI